MTGRVVGLDPGEKRVGIAVSDPSGTIATPYGFIDARTDTVVAAIVEICMEVDAATVVVGLPLRLDGSEGPAARRSRALGGLVRKDSELTIEFWDERFTTVTAEDALIEGNVRRSERKTKRDQVAAAVMLQGYLDKRKNDDRHGDTARGS